jgi:hypothetical protein
LQERVAELERAVASLANILSAYIGPKEASRIIDAVLRVERNGAGENG